MGKKDQSEATPAEHAVPSQPAKTDEAKASFGTAGGLAAPTIDQVRELLFGEAKRTTEQQLAAIETRIDELVADTDRRFAELERRVMEMDRATEERRVATVDMVGSAIVDLGNLIRSRAN